MRAIRTGNSAPQHVVFCSTHGLLQHLSMLGFSELASAEPNVAAVQSGDGETWSRGELFALTNQLTRALLESGLSRGDSIALVSRNTVECLAISLAGIQAGLYVVPINPHLAQSEVDFIIRDSEAQAVFVSDGVNMQWGESDAPVPRIMFGKIDGLPGLADFVAGYSSDPFEPEVIGRMMWYTSATTGRPKGVLLDLTESRQTLEKAIKHYRTGQRDAGPQVHLCTSTLYHAAPLENTLMALHMGHKVVLMTHWDPVETLRLIERERVTTTFMVPSMFVRLLKIPEPSRAAYSVASLRFVMHAGAPCPIDVKRKMLDWWGPIIWESYGAAEGAGTMVSPTEWLQFPGTVGRPIPGSKVRILDEVHAELPARQVGVVYFTRYTGDRFRYKGDPSKTRDCHVDEFFTVGDIGYVNEEGYLFLEGRRSDVIISSGTNIYASEIESALVQHPAVADCAVLGVKHNIFGEVPKAFIELVPGATESITLRMDVVDHLRARLAPSKVPHQLEFTSAIPRDPSGKLFKRRLSPVSR